MIHNPPGLILNLRALDAVVLSKTRFVGIQRLLLQLVCIFGLNIVMDLIQIASVVSRPVFPVCVADALVYS